MGIKTKRRAAKMDTLKIVKTYMTDNYSGPPMATDEVLALAAGEISDLRARNRSLQKDLWFYLNVDAEHLRDAIARHRSDVMCVGSFSEKNADRNTRLWRVLGDDDE